MAETLETDKDFFKRGLDYHNKGDFHKAISMYKKSMETYGVDKKTLVLLGNTYYMTKNFKEAKKLYKKALALDPNYSKAYFNLGIVYDGAQNFDLAIKAYKKTIELDNNFAEAYANLGDVYKSLQDMDRAVLNYLKALEIDSENENAKEGLKHIPDYLLEKVKDRDLMNRSDKLLRQGISDEKKGNISGARKKYEKALKIL
jgi:superkiller protein 3